MAELSAGQLVGLADRAHRLMDELAAAGFELLLTEHMRDVIHVVEGEAGARAVREMRATSDGDSPDLGAVPDGVVFGFRLADDIALSRSGALVRLHREAA
jgi:hypothetical protein